jgi:hypothetical protein
MMNNSLLLEETTTNCRFGLFIIIQILLANLTAIRLLLRLYAGLLINMGFLQVVGELPIDASNFGTLKLYKK